jgi:hypothetical protein
MKGGVLALIVLMVLAAISLISAATYPYLQAKIMPMLVCGIMLLLCSFELTREIRGTRKSGPAKKLLSEDEKEDKGEAIAFRSFLSEGSWMVAFFLAIYLLGFIAGIAVFTACYAGMRRTRWPVAIGLGISMAVLSFVLFSFTTDTELYPGFILKSMGLAG